MAFLDGTCKKGSKTEKWTSFWTKLTQQGYCQSKKVQNEDHHQILHFWISQGSKLKLDQRISIFLNIFSQKKKRMLPAKSRKNKSILKQINEHHHWMMLHNRISLGIKFHFEQTIFIFWLNVFKKKWVFVVMLNEHNPLKSA